MPRYYGPGVEIWRLQWRIWYPAASTPIVENFWPKCQCQCQWRCWNSLVRALRGVTSRADPKGSEVERDIPNRGIQALWAPTRWNLNPGDSEMTTGLANISSLRGFQWSVWLALLQIQVFQELELDSFDSKVLALFLLVRFTWKRMISRDKTSHGWLENEP